MVKILKEIIGNHPDKSKPIGILEFKDCLTDFKLPHRALSYDDAHSQDLVDLSAKWLINHHADHNKIERYKKALTRQGLDSYSPKSPLPSRNITQKGNWAEIILAEYLISSSNIELPVYRLRFNTNPDESMKGDDVLAFDLNSDPVRIIVGEAKFRSTPQKQDVQQMVGSLIRSNLKSVPASLEFVADRLFEQNKNDMAEKVANCAVLIAQGNLKIDYVGLLASNKNTPEKVNKNAKSELKNLVVISLAVSEPEKIVNESYIKANNLLKEDL